MPKRSGVDLSHFDFNRGEIGHLQTLANIPVVAGDSISVDLEGIFRLSPLRRNLLVDCQVDMFAFFVPHRHVYGEDWISFIKDGKNESITFAGVSNPDNVDYLGTNINGPSTIPLWLVAGYNQIWNRYFRSPTDDARIRADDYLPSIGADPDELTNGFRCGFLPQPWSTGTLTGVDDAERDVPVVGNVLDIVDLNRVQAEYRTEVDREYFGQRYNDLLNTAWGATVNTDADERPTLCGHSKFWMSGYDVDGTDDSSLGTYSGKSAAVGKFSIRRKFMPEHGSLWIMCLPRFPTIHTQERHNLHRIVDPSYLEIAGDDALVAAEPPADLEQDQFFNVSVQANLGKAPYGQWYRYHPNHVHRTYQVLDGFSFIDTDISSQPRAHYVSALEYDEVFQTTQLGHWQSHCRINVRCMRSVPDGRTSLYAGV